MNVRGLISIGTNSTRALVARVNGAPETLLHRSTGTRIGENLRERGHLEEAAMRRTLDAVEEHAAAIREFTPRFRVIATSALRRADNESEFDARVRALTGTGVEIISGEEEAACSFAGAVCGIDARGDETIGVLDVGGGSSEYALGTKANVPRVVSCEIGAVRLTEQFAQLTGSAACPVAEGVLQQARAAAREALAPALQIGRANRLVLVGGSATTAVSLVRGKRELFEYAELSAPEIGEWIERLASTPLAQRRTLAGINPQRADILLGGLLIVEEFMRANAHTHMLVSTRDVLLGYLLRHPA